MRTPSMISVPTPRFLRIVRASILALILPLLLSLAPASVPSAWAQVEGGSDPSAAIGRPNVNDYGRPGYPRITLTVWGNAQTGVWTVEQGTDLLEFLSVASRTDMNARADQRSYVVIQMYRKGQRGGTPVFEERLEDLLGRASDYPQMQEGDMILVKTVQRRRFTWRDIAQVTGTIAGLLNTYLILDRVSNNN